MLHLITWKTVRINHPKIMENVTMNTKNSMKYTSQLCCLLDPELLMMANA